MPPVFPPIIAKLQCFANSGFKGTCPNAYLRSTDVNYTFSPSFAVIVSASVFSKSSKFGIWYLSFFMFPFISLASSAIFIVLSRFTVITVGCIKTSSFISLTFSMCPLFSNFSNSFSTEFWSCKGMRRPFC